MDNSKPDMEKIAKLLHETGHTDYRVTLAQIHLEKTPSEALDMLLDSIGHLDDEEHGELLEESEITVAEVNTGKRWAVILDDSGTLQLQPISQSNLRVSLANMANLSHAEILWVLLRFMNYAADTQTVSADEVARRLDSLIKTVTRSG